MVKHAAPAWARGRWIVVCLIAGLLAGLVSLSTQGALATVSDCGISSGTLTPEEVPEGTSVVECDLVGRVVVNDGDGLTVPEPGMAAGIESLDEDGVVRDFQVEVSADGAISFLPEDTESSAN